MANLMQNFVPNFPQDPFPIPGVNTWVIRNAYYSHCEDYSRNRATNDDHIHFVRPCTRRLVNYLNQQRQAFDNTPNISPLHRLSFASIAGASGVGKTTEVFGWLQLQTMRGKIFLHSSLAGEISITTLGCESSPHTAHAHAAELDPKEAKTILREIARNGDIVVLDGAFPVSFINEIFNLALAVRLFVILCVSGQSFFTHASQLTNLSSGSDPENGRPIPSLIINGFTIEDYNNAQGIIVHDFDDSQQESRDSRYYYAGGSARIYYRFPDPRSYILQTISMSTNFENFFNAGDASQEALKTLKTYINGESSIVSEFAAKALSQRVDQAFIVAASARLPGNPAWQGWVAELDMLQRIRYCFNTHSTWQVRRFCTESTTKISWSINITEIIDYPDLAEVARHRPTYEEIRQNPMKAVIFIPAEWNNWGFDAVLVHFNMSSKKPVRLTPTVRFLQCTLAASHSKLFGKLAEFMQALFPLLPMPSTAYADVQQERFLPAVIEYSVMTWRHKCWGHRIGEGPISNIERIQRWQSKFSIPKNAQRYYFDADCEKDTITEMAFE